MPPLFGRRAQVLIQRAGNPTPLVFYAADSQYAQMSGPSTAAGIAVAQQLEGLHIDFKAEKNYQGQPNTLDLKIYNLSGSSRRQMQDQGAFVRLAAGYQADFPNLPLVFQGNARTIDHVRVGPDWVTRVQCGDGETAYRFGVVNRSWPAGTPPSSVAIELAQDLKAADPLNVDISAFVQKAPNLLFPLLAYNGCLAIMGNAFEELQRLLGSKYTLSIQDGEIRALQAQEGVVTGYKLSAATGLIGSPEHGTPNSAGLPSVLKLHCLLNPRIKPGDIFNVDSLHLTGNFRAQKVTHTGSLGGNDWFTEIDGTPLAAGVQSAN